MAKPKPDVLSTSMPAALAAQLDEVKASLPPGFEPAPITNIIGMAALTVLSQADLVARMKTEVKASGSRAIEMGKMLVALDALRPEGTTISKFANAMLGTGDRLDSAAYKVAKAWDLVGEGHGSITEAQFDRCQMRWLCTMSAIVGLLEKLTDEMQIAETREKVAAAVRDSGEATGATLAAIKDLLNEPERKAKETEAAAEKATAQKLAKEKEEAAAKGHLILDPLESPETLRTILQAIGKGIATCADAGILAMLVKGCGAIVDLANQRAAVITPVPVEAPVAVAA